MFGPGDAFSAFLELHATGPVALFEVDDVRSARAELLRVGIESYELASRRPAG